MTLLDEENIIKKANPIKKPKIMGIYFLLFRNKIIYVGSCKNIYARISTHKSNRN